MPVSITWNTTGVWGTGIGPLTEAQVDANFYSVKQAVEALEADRPEPNNIASITTAANGTQWIVWLDDGTQIGPLPIPVLQFRDRGVFVPFTVYSALDVFTDPTTGLYSVLIAHTAAATFDEDAGGTPIDVEDLVADRAYVISTVGDTDFTLIGATANTVGLQFVATGPGTGTGTAAPTLYNKLIGFQDLSGGGAEFLDELGDVTAPAPGDNDMLVFIGGSIGQWINQTPTQVTANLDEFTETAKGLVPAPGSGAEGSALFTDGWRIPVLDNLGDVEVPTTPSEGQLLVWDSASSTAQFKDVAGVSNTLGALTDVDLTSLADGDSLVYDQSSGHWINSASGPGITELTGDVLAIGPGTVTATLAATGVSAGTYGNPTMTVDVKGRITAIANGTSTVNSAALDAAFGSTRGSILERSASGWVIITPGTAGFVFTSNGAGADPAWAAPGGGGFSLDDLDDVDTTGEDEGSLLVFHSGSGGGWSVLTAGISGQSLRASATGIGWGYSTQKEAVAVVASSPLDFTPTYDNGPGNDGTGATLTAGSNGVLEIDGVTAFAVGDRVLIAGQADATENGVYEFTQLGTVGAPYILTRTSDWDGTTIDAVPTGVRLGDSWSVYGGSANKGLWTFTAASTVGYVNFGESELTFEKIAVAPDAVPVIPYGISFSSPQTTAYTASQVIGHHKVGIASTIAANFGDVAGHACGAGGTANATGSTVFSVEQAGAATPNTFSQIGTITFGAGGVTATFATASGTSKALAQGDVLRVVAPSSPDATFVGFYASLFAAR